MNSKLGLALAAGILGAVSLPPAFADANSDAVTLMQDNWREAIARTATPREGCFEAEFPNAAWVETACSVAPDKVYLPRGGIKETTGDGHDYSAQVTSGIMTSGVGSFPTVTGVTSETDGGKNVYSIQLNSNFMNTAVCSGHSNCQSWEQFVYSSSEKSAFMQYWLINYGSKCPSGWNSFQGSCYKNSAAVTVPKQPISTLASLKLSGTAVANGTDTLVFTTPTKAYSTTGPDSVVLLATGWKSAEFNLVGDGGGSAAKFNTGSHVTVKLAVTNGTSNAPTCLGPTNGGTTGETNNLNLGSCSASGGATPSIQFTESN